MKKSKLVTALFLLSACASGKTEHSIPITSSCAKEYLACYALDKLAKKKCTDKLAKKYTIAGKTDIQKFQFEAEKIGFKNFLNEKGKLCESIDNGPEFVKSENAYIVWCKPSQLYFMQFDYDKKQWSIDRSLSK